LTCFAKVRKFYIFVRFQQRPYVENVYPLIGSIHTIKNVFFPTPAVLARKDKVFFVAGKCGHAQQASQGAASPLPFLKARRRQVDFI
jgi:hypothetical protein